MRSHLLGSFALACLGSGLVACEDQPATVLDMSSDTAMAVSWDKGLAPMSALFPARRGLQVVRGAIHIHTPYSHDACDGKPQPDGKPDPTCLEHLRAALCKLHYDYAMLTDHGTFVADTAWDDLFLPSIGTTPISEGGKHVASRLACPDGSTTLLTVGSENELMPIGLDEEVAATPAERHTILGGTDGATATALRSHGALIAVAHGEAHSDQQLAEVDPDALEIYNLHANIGPNIRAAMGLDPGAAIAALLPFIDNPDPSIEPDMAMLAFWEENPIELDRLEVRWSAGAHVLATAGVDAHENAVSAKMADGERGDAYRRVMRWFSNHLLVDELSAKGLKTAIGKGRGYVAFEVFGSPVGFDFRAEAAGAIAEIGDEVAVGSELVLEAPKRPEIAPADLTLRILRVADGTSTEVASGSGASPLRFAIAQPGAYRAEVRILPRHLKQYMGALESKLDKPFVWIYASPIYAR